MGFKVSNCQASFSSHFTFNDGTIFIFIFLEAQIKREIQFNFGSFGFRFLKVRNTVDTACTDVNNNSGGYSIS